MIRMEEKKRLVLAYLKDLADPHGLVSASATDMDRGVGVTGSIPAVNALVEDRQIAVEVPGGSKGQTIYRILEPEEGETDG